MNTCCGGFEVDDLLYYNKWTEHIAQGTLLIRD